MLVKYYYHVHRRPLDGFLSSPLVRLPNFIYLPTISVPNYTVVGGVPKLTDFGSNT